MMLPTIPTPDELLDKGFRRGKKAADLRRGEKMPKHLKGKRIEETRVITACQVIKDRLKMILDRTPEIEELPEFYQVTWILSRLYRHHCRCRWFQASIRCT